MQEGRNASRDRQRYRKTDVQIYIQTNRNKDVQTYTDKQTDRRTVQKYWYRLKTDRCTERPILTHMAHTYSTVHKTDIQTDRQTGQTEKNDKTDQQTDRQTVYECCVKKSDQNS
jgi:hypothetical protein